MLKIQNLCYKIAQSDIIKDFNLHLESGKIITLFGASGCGKSTLLRCIAGILSAESGEISAPKSAFVFQNSALFENLTAFENVAVVMEKVNNAWILEHFDNFHLNTKDTQKYPHELSGGMKARVSFLRALAYNAPLFLLDEPFSGLDLAVKKILIGALLERVKNGDSALLVTHDAFEACLCSDEIYFLKSRFMEVEQILQINKDARERNSEFVDAMIKAHFKDRIYFE